VTPAAAPAAQDIGLLFQQLVSAGIISKMKEIPSLVDLEEEKLKK